MPMETPVAFSEKMIRPENKFWKPEEWDKHLPSSGFITDFVLATRGIKTPTKFCTWSAMFLLSAILKRDAWFEWWPNKFFLNLYVILVAPPAYCAKSHAINFGEHEILRKCGEFIGDSEIRLKKQLQILHSKATNEGIVKVLKPEQLYDEEKDDYVDMGSQITFIISELSTFLGKQQYNIGLIEKLTDLYDCKDTDDALTAGRGLEELKNIYISLIGATTPDSVEDSIPIEAFGGGFISRLIIVYQDLPTRIYPKPQGVVGGPTPRALAQRLAWIAENAQGEYKFSPTAEQAYNVWYKKFMNAIIEDPSSLSSGGARYDNHLLKIATLIRIQRYEKGNIIALADFEDALQLLSATVNNSRQVTSNIGGDKIIKAMHIVGGYIKRRGGQVDRKRVLTANSSRITSALLNTVLSEYIQRGKIKVYNQHGNILSRISSNMHERYEWIGGDEL